MLVDVDSIARATRYAMVLVEYGLVEYGYEEVDIHYREMWPERIVLIRRETAHA